jgi:hypothetical protein
MPRHDSYDDERAYEKWCEYREQQEEAERQEAWEAEVDENCKCVYEEDNAHYRYYDWDYVKPIEICTWHAERAAAAAKAAAAEAAAALAKAAEKKVYVEEMAARLRVELPANYIVPQISIPPRPSAHEWRDQILYVRERLYLLQGSGLPEETRLKLISEVFEFLAQPENVGLVRSNAKFRAVVEAKLAEFRGDSRAELIRESLERMEAVLAA